MNDYEVFYAIASDLGIAINDLEYMVKKKQLEGWMLQGGVSISVAVAAVNVKFVAAQAMTLPAPN